MSEQSVAEQYGPLFGAKALGKSLELSFHQLIAKASESVIETILSFQDKLQVAKEVTNFRAFSKMVDILTAEASAIAPQIRVGPLQPEVS